MLVLGEKDVEQPTKPDPQKHSGMFSMEETLEYLSEKNECKKQKKESFTENGETGTIYKRTKCKNGADVEIVVLDDAGHSPYLLDPKFFHFPQNWPDKYGSKLYPMPDWLNMTFLAPTPAYSWYFPTPGFPP